MKKTGGRGSTYNIGKAINGQYGLEFKGKNIAGIRELYRDAQANNLVRIKDNKIAIKREFKERVDKLANDMANRMYYTDDSQKDIYDGIKSMTKGSYYLSKRDRNDIADFRQFARGSGVKVTNSRQATSIDSLYKELSHKYPSHFPKSITAPSDQYRQIVKQLKETKPTKVRMDASYRNAAAKEISQKLTVAYINTRLLRKKR